MYDSRGEWLIGIQGCDSKSYWQPSECQIADWKTHQRLCEVYRETIEDVVNQQPAPANAVADFEVLNQRVNMRTMAIQAALERCLGPISAHEQGLVGREPRCLAW